jgi:tetratricopeptide (TPR) repeat protein
MRRVFLSSLAIYLMAGPGWGQTDGRPTADSRSVLGQGNELLSAGADAIRAGLFDDGIRLTSLGLQRHPVSPAERAGAYANLCAAHAAKGEADIAIDYCTESLALNERSWRAYSNRSYAYYLKAMYPEALRDLNAAAAMAPDARQVKQIRGMINERNLRPRITMEDHQ